MNVRAETSVKICGQVIHVYFVYDLYNDAGAGLYGQARYMEEDILININIKNSTQLLNTFIHECHHWYRYLTGFQAKEHIKYKFDCEELADHVSCFITQLLNENPDNLFKNIKNSYNLALRNFKKNITVKEIDE